MSKLSIRPSTATFEPDDSDAWKGIIEKIAAEGPEHVAELQNHRLQLTEQRDALSELIVQAEAFEIQHAALRQAALVALARVKQLNEQNAALDMSLGDAELGMAVATEEVSALTRQFEEEKTVNQRLKDQEQAREKRIAIAQEKAAKSKAAEGVANHQLSDALKSLDELRLANSELERGLADINAGLNAVSQEREIAQQRWAATDQQKDAQIRELKEKVDHLELAAKQQQEQAFALRMQERESLEAAWEEATTQKETLAVSMAEANARIELIERQQEVFISKFVDEYNEKAAQAKRELEELRARLGDDEALQHALAERDEARRELDATRTKASDRSALLTETEALRENRGSSQATDEPDPLRVELDHMRIQLDEARSGVDRLLADCAELNAENVRLQQLLEQEHVPTQAGDPRDQDPMVERVSVIEKQVESLDVEDSSRRAGSYSMISDIKTGGARRRSKQSADG